jgi:hypothetical protein
MIKNLPTVFLAAAILSGCTICTDCEPEYYPGSSPQTISQYPASSRNRLPVRSIRQRGQQFSPTAYYNRPAPLLWRPWWNQPVSNGYYNNYGASYYGGGYSGPPFQTPPMQPMPYPAEWYYPFKRPAPGIFVPWNRMYYPLPQSSYSYQSPMQWPYQ